MVPMRIRLAVTVSAFLAFLVAGASPAQAHNVGGATSSNYRTRITSVEPDIDGITVRVVEAGARIELVNRTDDDVVVFGYKKEPYLRVGPDGVYQNIHSPATYLNRSMVPMADVTLPEQADARAEPEWKKVSDDHKARWHDHRSHHMGTRAPPKVRQAPGETHNLRPFQVRMTHAGTDVEVRGDLFWIPGPSRWTWLGPALLVGAAVALLVARSRRGDPGPVRFALAATLAVILVLDVARFTGQASDADISFPSALGDNLLAVVTWAAALAALVFLVRRGLREAAPVLAAAGLLFALGSLVDLDLLTHSQLPSTAPEWVSRLAVAAGFGLGAGLAGAAIARIMRPPVTSA
ncbi:MAG: hypothetical protein ACRDY7_13405 [Acidimicrobiia bacterium]